MVVADLYTEILNCGPVKWERFLPYQNINQG